MVRSIRIRVAYVVGALDLGGTERQLVALARGLDRSKFVPIVFCLTATGPLVSDLEQAGVEGEVHRVDIFEPPELLLGRFDVVFSFGVLEHFSPTERALGQMAKFVRPSGKIITIIPNMTHAVGWLQKTVDRKVYDIHVPLDDRDLAAAHEACGLRLLEASYLGTVNWCVVNYANLSGRWWQPAIIRLAAWASKVVWLGESAGVPEVPNRWTSPYIGAVAEVA